MSTMARLKKTFSLAIDPKLIERLDAWIAKQSLPPTKTAFVELALKELLDKVEKRK